MDINKNSYIPMYIQIANILRKEIESKKIKTGDSIGAQRELEERFGVSKITIRKAVNILEQEDLVITKQGKGTFVKAIKFEDDLIELQGLSDIITRSGFSPEISIVKIIEKETPEELLSDKLKGFSEKCFYIERLHTVKDKPIAFVEIYLPYEIGKSLSKEDIEKNTLYTLFQDKLNIELGEGIQTIKACKANKKLAEHLNIDVGEALLNAERIAYDKNNNIVEFIVFYYNFNEYAFKIKRKLASNIKMWPK